MSSKKEPRRNVHNDPGAQPYPIKLRPSTIQGETVCIYTREIPSEVNDAFDLYIREKGYSKREALLTLIRWVYVNAIDLGPFLAPVRRTTGAAAINIREVPYLVSDKFRIWCISAGATQQEAVTAIMKWAAHYKFDLTLLP